MGGLGRSAQEKSLREIHFCFDEGDCQDEYRFFRISELNALDFSLILPPTSTLA
jgi:hypothetical protein